MKRVGFILECQREGPEEQVFTYLVKQIRQDVEPIFECLNSKQYILPLGGATASRLLTSSKCEHVFIVWDHAPPFDKKKSCVDECDAVQTILGEKSVDREKVTLVCISYEIEAWLLADTKALEDLLVSKNHQERISPVGAPAREKDPKSVLAGLFKKHAMPPRRYCPSSDALKILRKVENLARLERVQSFKHFRRHLETFDTPSAPAKPRRSKPRRG
jgi:hypothetical protein